MALFVAVLPLVSGTARAQSLTVLPVSIQLLPGQRTATLTVINRGSVETSIQIRAYDWGQPNGIDQLTSSNAILVSPPLATIASGATQTVRIVLRRTPERSEDSYRILLDQIPPPAEPGIVHVVLRMSIPIFAVPKTRLPSHIQFHIEQDSTQMYLVAVNDSLLHESIRDMALWTEDGARLKVDFSGSPYLLAGVTRRWPVTLQVPALGSGSSLRLKAIGLTGPIDQQVHIVEIP